MNVDRLKILKIADLKSELQKLNLPTYGKKPS